MDLTGYRFLTLLLRFEILIAVPLVLYIHYFKLPALEKYFEHNDIIQRNKARWRSYLPLDKALRMGQISNFLSHPNRYIRSGDVTAEEIASVPVALKRWATWPYYFLYQLVALMGLRYVLYEL